MEALYNLEKTLANIFVINAKNNALDSTRIPHHWKSHQILFESSPSGVHTVSFEELLSKFPNI